MAAPDDSLPLQVSDREWLATQPSTAQRLQRAEEMVAAGDGEEVCFRAHEIDGAAVSARRFVALAGRRGDDDMFSTDFTDAELQVRLPWFSSVLRGGRGWIMGADDGKPKSGHLDRWWIG